MVSLSISLYKKKNEKKNIDASPVLTNWYSPVHIQHSMPCKLIKRFPKLNYKYGSPQETYSPS